MSSVFTSLYDRKVAALIDGASARVALVAPAFRREIAEALQRAVARLGGPAVGIVSDCNEEVFRLGYGEMDALIELCDSDGDVRQARGLRIGVLVCDSRAWAFAPTALYVQREVHSDETPNAIAIPAPAVDAIAAAILPAALTIQDVLSDVGPQVDFPRGVEVGLALLAETEVHETLQSLQSAPPIPFDIARQVRVFEPYIQYVEISLRGCAIQRYRVEVPRAIQGLDSREELSSRLRTTFELIERNSEISSKALETELNKIRESFTRSLGQPWGRVMLRAVRPVFDERVDEFRNRLEIHRRSVEQSLAEQLEDSRGQLVDHFLPNAVQTPPDSLLGQIMGPPSEGQVRDWLDEELKSVFPDPSDLVKDMTLDVQFKDVTYETLSEAGFAEKLRDAYPRLDWDKPFNEFNAARACADPSPEAPAAAG